MIQRGIDRAACFFSDEDRQVYLDALGGLARSCGVAIHAYVLMTNHVHLLVTASAQPNLSALMKRLGQRYADCDYQAWAASAAGHSLRALFSTTILPIIMLYCIIIYH